MKKSFWNKRIPTVLGLLLITIGIGLTSYFVKQGIFFITKASPTDNPQEVRITNITDSSATISFVTNGDAIGSLNLGEKEENFQKILDDQDQASGKISLRRIHSLTARNLKPSTKYYFSITSGQETYLNKDVLYELTTGAKIDNEPPKQEPIAGKVLLPDGKAPKEALIYATIEGAQVVSTIVKNDGAYILPLNSLRKLNLSSYFDFSETMNIKMTISGDSYSSNVLLSKNQINPVPQVTLSKDYDFTTSLEPEASQSAKLEKLPSFPANSTNQGVNTPSIISPQKEQGLSDQQPEFKGKALPNESVKIVINSENQIEAEITADKYGNWSYQPQKNLSPGQHTVSIITRDAQGILRTITQSFTVYAAGSQFTDSMSPSPTISLKQTPTVTKEPTITITPTTTPIPTIVTTTTTIIISTPSASIPASPGSSSLLNLGFVGITTIILGIVLLLLSRGSMAFL